MFFTLANDFNCGFLPLFGRTRFGGDGSKSLSSSESSDFGLDFVALLLFPFATTSSAPSSCGNFNFVFAFDFEVPLLTAVDANRNFAPRVGLFDSPYTDFERVFFGEKRFDGDDVGVKTFFGSIFVAFLVGVDSELFRSLVDALTGFSLTLVDVGLAAPLCFGDSIVSIGKGNACNDVIAFLDGESLATFNRFSSAVFFSKTFETFADGFLSLLLCFGDSFAAFVEVDGFGSASDAFFAYW